MGPSRIYIISTTGQYRFEQVWGRDLRFPVALGMLPAPLSPLQAVIELVRRRLSGKGDIGDMLADLKEPAEGGEVRREGAVGEGGGEEEAVHREEGEGGGGCGLCLGGVCP